MDGDFNDIKCKDETRGGRERNEGSFGGFRQFISNMEVRDIKFEGDPILGQTIGIGRVSFRKDWTGF